MPQKPWRGGGLRFARGIARVYCQNLWAPNAANFWRLIMRGLLSLCVGVFVAGAALAEEMARGVVYHDQNENGARDAGEPGVPGVPVSNGVDVVLTDAEGRYELPITDNATIFLIKPSGWQVPMSRENLPQFYYNHVPEGSPELRYAGVAPTGPLPESVDFPMVKHEEAEEFVMLCLGDTQPRNQAEVDYLSQDIVTELADFDAVFGATLGDLVFDDLDVLEPIAKSIGLIGMPWYHVIGNHDINFDAPTPRLTVETYRRIFGPDYYAFNYGQVHFISMNNIMWDVEAERYHGELGEQQLQFMENNLAHVPKDRLIVLMSHIPLTQTRDVDKVFALLEDFPHTFSVAAHWHRQQHFFMDSEFGWNRDEPHHHLINVTACGSWLRGPFDEVGIPFATQSDGVPSGYSIINFSGTDYSIRYKATRRPADYQMNIYAPQVITPAEAGETTVTANVFAGSERCEVRMRLGRDGDWVPMEQVERLDPVYEELVDREQLLRRLYVEGQGRPEALEDAQAMRAVNSELQPAVGLTLPTPRETNHIWEAKLPENPEPGYHMIYVRATDMFGQEHEGRRVIRIEE